MSSKVKITNEGMECSVGLNIVDKSLIQALKNEERELLKKIENSRENKDFGTYKNLIRALADVTMLKQRELDRLPKESWTDMYSHYYEGKYMDDEYVATWRQKGQDIKDHKIYKIEKEIPSVKINVELDKNYTIDGDNLTIPMKINGKDCSINGKKVDNKWVLESETTIKCN